MGRFLIDPIDRTNFCYSNFGPAKLQRTIFGEAVVHLEILGWTEVQGNFLSIKFQA